MLWALAEERAMAERVPDDATVLSLEGTPVPLRDLVDGRPLVLAFLRHFG